MPRFGSCLPVVRRWTRGAPTHGELATEAPCEQRVHTLSSNDDAAEAVRLPRVKKGVSWTGSDDTYAAGGADEVLEPVGCQSSMSDGGDMICRISSRKSDYSEQVQEVLTLDCSTLLRGVPVTDVLRCFGRIWASSEGTEEDYELSVPVSHIDHFLSHAWATPRHRKVIALMIYYNFLPALTLAFGWAFAAFLAKAMGILQVGSMEDAYFIVGESAWLIALFFLHDFYCLFGTSLQTYVFLDKVCIHQTDPAIKAKGIKGLPAFLQSSRAMVILYSDAYLTRLWTVYELASYLLLQPDGRVEFLPVDIPQLPLIGLVIVSFAPRSHFYEFWWVAELIGLLLMSLMCRWLAALHKRMYAAFENFDMFETKCFYEADRRVVESNVEAYMKHMGHVHVDATQMESLDAFNDLVRSTVPGLLRASLGTIGIPYRFTVMVDIPGIVQMFDLLWVSFWKGDPLMAQVVDFSLTISHWVLIGPITLAAGVWVAKAFVEKDDVWAMVLTLAATFSTLFVVEWALAVPFFLLTFLAQYFPVVALLGWPAYCCVLLAALFQIYGVPEHIASLFRGGRPRHRRASLMGAFSSADIDGAVLFDVNACSSPTEMETDYFAT